MFWILVGIGVTFLVYYTLVKPFYYWADRGVPCYTVWDSWINFVAFATQYHRMSDAIIKLYNDFPNTRYSGVHRFFTPALLVRDPDLIKQIISKDFDNFVDRQTFLPVGAEPLWDKSLLALKGDKWRDMRATLSPSFTSSKMKMMFGLMSDCATKFVKYFEEQDSESVTVEMKDIFGRFANDVIASTAFGVTCDSLKNRDNTFYLKGKLVTIFAGNFWAFLKFISFLIVPRISKIFGLTLFSEELRSFFRGVIKENIQARERDGIVRPDMIHLLMEARKERSKIDENEKRQKEQLTDEDITAQALAFFLAGFDSVSSLMSFMSYELATHPEIQQQLQDEVDTTLSDCGGTLTYEALLKMKYMEMVVSESLRKWPATLIVDRICDKPYTIQPTKEGEKPVRLEKGEAVFIPIFAIHWNPEFFPEPERFDPERFREEKNPNAYMPFGVGPRMCIGTRFALMETKLLFFYILSKFEFTVIEKTPIPLKLARNQFQLNAEGGFWLGLKKR